MGRKTFQTTLEEYQILMPARKVTHEGVEVYDRSSLPPERTILSRAVITAGINTQRAQTAARLSKFIQNPVLEEVMDQLILEMLDHPEFTEMIDQGKITYAMIKPEANCAKKENESLSDDHVAELVKAEIKAPLQIIFSKNFAISKEAAKEFYAHLSDRADLFEIYTSWMSSGAITAMIIYEPSGNAVLEWRKQMGPTNPKKADGEGRMDRIRHRYADTIDNNVTHGSDSVENVKRELEWFKKQFLHFSAQLKTPADSL